MAEELHRVYSAKSKAYGLFNEDSELAEALRNCRKGQDDFLAFSRAATGRLRDELSKYPFAEGGVVLRPVDSAKRLVDASAFMLHRRLASMTQAERDAVCASSPGTEPCGPPLLPVSSLAAWALIRRQIGHDVARPPWPCGRLSYVKGLRWFMP